jgi:hypothetical protein
MKFRTRTSLSACCLLSGILATNGLAFSMPVQRRESPEATELTIAEKFGQIRTTYLQVAGMRQKPNDGMKKLVEVFPLDAGKSKVTGSITGNTECIPPSLPSSDPEDQALYKAYCASFVAFEARDRLWPQSKLDLANKSLMLLDSAVTAAPRSLEVRALRLAVTHHLPFFFDRGDQAQADAKWLKGRTSECNTKAIATEPGCRIDKRITSLLKFIG